MAAMSAALVVCWQIARRSGKSMGKAAACVLLSLAFPLAGNAAIVLSGNRGLSLAGCYIYYLGLDLVIAALLRYTFVYCGMRWSSKRLRNAVYSFLLADFVQLVLNPFFHHAFEVSAIEVEGFDYYRMIPRLGQSFHRLVDYLILLGIIVVFVVRLIRAPRLQSERYSVILFSLVFVSVWETVYIFSGEPVDRSMLGFGVFGLLIFYFSLYYRPMRLLDRMLSGVISELDDPMYFFDDKQNCIWMNRSGQAFLGLGEQETDRAGNELERTFGTRHPGEAEWKDQLTLARDGASRFMELSKVPLLDKHRTMNGFYIHVRDLTDEQRDIAQKLYNARHDSLTGLYNRDYLFERTREVLEQNPEEPFLFVSAEISDLKLINDLYGKTFGDYALKYSADWIRNFLTGRAVFGRLGGDSFGVCIAEKDFSQDRLERSLSDFLVSDGGTKYHMLIHIGIYRAEEREAEPPVMYDRAQLAADSIREDYHFNIAWYEEAMRARAVRNRQISIELAPALEQGQLRPWLQPVVDREGRTIGAETLVRWIHPEEGIRTPESFIPIFEKNGMVAEVDRYMWRRACGILAEWKAEGRDLFLSVNISPKDFRLLDVGAELKALVKEYGIEPARLRLEVTESVMMDDREERLEALRDLRAAGFCIEMDDFGSGYSSLNLLREMPVDVLKIDIAFLQQTDRDSRARTILRQVIVLAKALGITSLTEGVETEAQFAGLAEMGCELYQGFYFAQPMPPEEFERRLAEGL